MYTGLLQVIVTYGQDHVNEFIDLADAIEDAFPELLVEGAEVEHNSQGFSVKTEEGTVVIEQKAGEALPEAASIVESLRQAGFQ